MSGVGDAFYYLIGKAFLGGPGAEREIGDLKEKGFVSEEEARRAVEMLRAQIEERAAKAKGSFDAVAGAFDEVLAKAFPDAPEGKAREAAATAAAEALRRWLALPSKGDVARLEAELRAIRERLDAEKGPGEGVAS